MSVSKKACLFCGQFVNARVERGSILFAGCHCTPEGVYTLEENGYETIRALPFADKNRLFPLLSGYIREAVDRGEAIELSADRLEEISRSPRIPATLAEKEKRLLQYLRRHADGPGEAVALPQLSACFNLTYSPNLQEFVFVIEKLREARLLEREGASFRLTEKGWREAALDPGESLPNCVVWVPEHPRSREEWERKVLPRIRQCGYVPKLADSSGSSGGPENALLAMADCRLLIVDVTGRQPDAFLAGGYAMGRDIPVIWTENSEETEQQGPAMNGSIRPMGWSDGEQLASLLEQRLAH